MTLRSILGSLGLAAKPTPTDLRVLTGVSATLNATHRSRDHGDVHAHTWEVTVWCVTEGQANAVMIRNHLDKLLSRYEGKCLPDSLAWAEDLGVWIMYEMGPDHQGYDGWIGRVYAVEIRRAKEGLLARIEHSPRDAMGVW